MQCSFDVLSRPCALRFGSLNKFRTSPVLNVRNHPPTGVQSRQEASFARPGRIFCQSSEVSTASTSSKDALFQQLKEAAVEVTRAPLSLKNEAAVEVMNAMKALQTVGALPKWGAVLESPPERRNVFLGELKRVGIKEPAAIGTPSTRNDLAFLVTVVGSTSVVAVVAGVVLPGDWGFFVPYLVGSISLVVLAVGSVAPGLLQVAIDKFSQVYPDYRERVLRHEAAHFLIGYLCGVPVASYSVAIGKEHTDFAEARLQKRLIEKRLDDIEVDSLALVAMAGATAEGMNYTEVIGQTADLVDLQRILLRSQSPLSAAQQQNMTRWAVYHAAQLLNTYAKEYEALIGAMGRGAPINECIEAIENA